MLDNWMYAFHKKASSGGLCDPRRGSRSDEAREARSNYEANAFRLLQHSRKSRDETRQKREGCAMRCCELESAVLAGKVRAAEMAGLAQEGQAQKCEKKIRRVQLDVQCHQGELDVAFHSSVLTASSV